MQTYTHTHTFLLVRISQRSGVLFLGHAGTDQVTGDNIWCLLGELCVYICTNNTLIPPRVLQRALLCVCVCGQKRIDGVCMYEKVCMCVMCH